MFEFPAFLLPTNLGQPLYIQPISPDCRNFLLDPVYLYWRELTCLLTDHDSRFLLLRNYLSTNPHTEQRPSFWNRVCRRRRWNGTYLHGRDFYDMKLGRWGLPGNCAHLYAFSQVAWTTHPVLIPPLPRYSALQVNGLRRQNINRKCFLRNEHWNI